jgi:hypothetical protein
MSDVKKPKDAPKTAPAETKAVETKTEAATTESKPDAARKKQGIGEGQKPVSKAYKDTGTTFLGKRKSAKPHPRCCHAAARAVGVFSERALEG